jgi:hypothetical protein
MATLHPIRKAHQEHSVPWFWPLTAAIELGEEGMRLFQRNLEYLVQAHVINAPPLPEWARRPHRSRTRYAAPPRFLEAWIGSDLNACPDRSALCRS